MGRARIHSVSAGAVIQETKTTVSYLEKIELHILFYISTNTTKANKMTKFHFIRHRPTVLEEFPLDVIRVHIFPCLDYESRIHFNQCLAPCDRLSKMMNPMAIRAHERKVRVNALKDIQYGLLDVQYPFSQEGATKRIKILTNYFRLHSNPLYFTIIKDNENYRNMTLSKIQEFTQELISYNGSVCINHRIRLVKEMTKLKKVIENSMPYGPDVKYSSHIYRLDFS